MKLSEITAGKELLGLEPSCACKTIAVNTVSDTVLQVYYKLLETVILKNFPQRNVILKTVILKTVILKNVNKHNIILYIFYLFKSILLYQ